MSAAVPNHRRTKPGGIKPSVANNSATGPTSQIPGLCQSATVSSPVERASGRRVGIFDSDSDYTKLAKQGGHKGLLSHDDNDDQPKKTYNPNNWFGDDQSNGDEPVLSPSSSVRPLSAPFGTDELSCWDREKSSPDGALRQMEGLSVTSKFKRTSYDKKAPPVSMTKLLSHGYMEDKKKKKSNNNDDDDTSSVTSEQTSTVTTEEVEDLE